MKKIVFTLMLLLLPNLGIAADWLPTEGLRKDVFLGGLPPLPPSPEEAGFLLNTQEEDLPSKQKTTEMEQSLTGKTLLPLPMMMAHLVPLHTKDSASSAAKSYKKNRISRSGTKYGLCRIGNCQKHCKSGIFLYKHLQSSHTETERESIFYICATHNYATHSSGSKCYHLQKFHSTQP
jgi:hypothetical protein